MLAIAIILVMQRLGLGTNIVNALELSLKERGVRIIIVDTSGKPDYKGVRTFYRSVGYTEEARIRDFWADGDDKIIFWKSLFS